MLDVIDHTHPSYSSLKVIADDLEIMGFDVYKHFPGGEWLFVKHRSISLMVGIYLAPNHTYPAEHIKLTKAQLKFKKPALQGSQLFMYVGEREQDQLDRKTINELFKASYQQLYSALQQKAQFTGQLDITLTIKEFELDFAGSVFVDVIKLIEVDLESEGKDELSYKCVLDLNHDKIVLDQIIAANGSENVQAWQVH